MEEAAGVNGKCSRPNFLTSVILITHTFTKNDAEFFAGVAAQHVSAAAKSWAKVRWPFRVAYAFVSVFLVALGCGLVRTNTLAGLACLLIGLVGIFGNAGPPLLAKLASSRVKQAMLSRVGSAVTWEINDEGIAFCGDRMPWSKFESYKTVDSGVLIDGSALVLIPAGAISDESVKSQLAEILKNKLGSLPPAQAR